MRDGRTNDDDKQLKIELLSQWKLEAEFRKKSRKGYFSHNYQIKQPLILFATGLKSKNHSPGFTLPAEKISLNKTFSIS